MAERKTDASRVIVVVLSVMNGVGVIGTVILSLAMRGRFAAMFKELGAALPVMTRVFLSLHPAVLIVAAAILLAVLVAAAVAPGKVAPHVLNAVVLIVGIAYWVFFTLAMFLPVLSLLNAAGGG